MLPDSISGRPSKENTMPSDFYDRQDLLNVQEKLNGIIRRLDGIEAYLKWQLGQEKDEVDEDGSTGRATTRRDVHPGE